MKDRYKYYVPLRNPPCPQLILQTSVKFVDGCYITQGFHTNQDIEPTEAGVEASLQGLMSVLKSRKGEQWAVNNIQTTPCIDEIIRDI